MRAGMIDMESNTTLVQNYPAHEAVPDGQGPFPTVVVFHERFGLNLHVKGVANRLAREGFYALAPNFYALPSSFAAVAPTFMRTLSTGSIDYDNELAAREHAATLSDERAETIFRQAFNYLATRSKARSGGMGALGFSMGGRLAFLAACRMPEDVHTCVCFYGTGIASGAAPHPGQSHPIEEAESLRASLLLFYGQLDDTIRSEERERIQERLSKLGKDFRIEVFPEAGHDFFCSERESYRIHASKIAWEETLALLRRSLGGINRSPDPNS